MGVRELGGRRGATCGRWHGVLLFALVALCALGVHGEVDIAELGLDGEEVEGALTEATFPTTYYHVNTRDVDDAGSVVGLYFVLVGDLDLFVSRDFTSPSALNAEHRASGPRSTRSLGVLNSGRPPFEMGDYYVGVSHRMDLGEPSAFSLCATVWRDGDLGLPRGGHINVTDHDPLRLAVFPVARMARDWNHATLTGDAVKYEVWVYEGELGDDALRSLHALHMSAVEGVVEAAAVKRAHVKEESDGTVSFKLGSLSAGVHVLNIIATDSETGSKLAYVPQAVVVKEHRSAVVALAEFLVYGVAPLLSLCFGTSYLFSGRDDV